MKRQFRHEAHTRQDKANKEDYHFDMRERPISHKTWSNVSTTGGGRRVSIAESDQVKSQVASKIHCFWFVYGRYIFRFTRNIEAFAEFNGLSPNDSQTGELYERLFGFYKHDLPLIQKAIKAAKVIRPVGAFGIRLRPCLDLNLPPNVFADSISQKLPKEFRKPGRPPIDVPKTPSV